MSSTFPFLIRAEIPSLEEFKEMDFYHQYRSLRDASVCYEGSKGEIKKLREYVNYLNDKYLGREEFYGVTNGEWRLIVELMNANLCAYDYETSVTGIMAVCKLQNSIIDEIPADMLDELLYGCWLMSFEGTPYSEEEKIGLEELMKNKFKKLFKRIEAEKVEKGNWIKFMYGMLLCNTKVKNLQDCPRGLEIMYEAALDEYIEKGAEGFDKDLAERLSTLEAFARDMKEIQKWVFARELQIKLLESGHPSVGGMDKSYLPMIKRYPETLAKWASKGITEAAHTKSLEELVRERKATSSIPPPSPVTPPSPITQPAEKELPVTGPVYEKPSPITSPVEKPVSSFGHLIRIFLILIYILIGIVVIGIILTIVLLVRKGER